MKHIVSHKGTEFEEHQFLFNNNKFYISFRKWGKDWNSFTYFRGYNFGKWIWGKWSFEITLPKLKHISL